MVRKMESRDVRIREGLALHCLCQWATRISEGANAPDTALRTPGSSIPPVGFPE